MARQAMPIWPPHL